MRRRLAYFTLAILLPTLGFCSDALGWAGTTHATLCAETFDDPVVSPLLSGINQSSIESYIGEPGDFQHSQWATIDARAYIDTAAPYAGNNWNALDETTRLKYLQHNTTDVAVPLGHSPANQVYTNTVAEAILEAQVATWLTHPSIVGTTSYTHSRTNHTYNFTGNISQVCDTFEAACLDNANWFKSTKNWLGLHSTSDNHDAGWNGEKLGLMLQRAVMVDYFLAKETPVAVANNEYGVSGQWMTFDSSDSYDPDAVSWNSNGTYSQTYGIADDGLQLAVWDFDVDGVWDYGNATDGTLPIDVDRLLNLFGRPADQWTPYYVGVVDDEGKLGVSTGYMYLDSGSRSMSMSMSMMPTVSAVPEPTTISLLFMGVAVLLLRRRRQA